MPDSPRLARQTAITAGLLVMNNPSTVSYRKIWLMSYPLMISLIIEHMIGLTDAIFLGRVGDVALGACALGGVYYMAMFRLAFGFGFGAQIIIARRNGERRYNRIAPTMIQGCYFMLALALLLFFASRYLSPSILRHAIESPQVFGATMEYLHWRTYGVFFSFLCVMFRSYYVGITQTKILTVNSIVMLLSNVVLNYCLIFGKGGFPAMGVAGAAIASSVAEAVSLVFFIIYTGITADKRKYGFRRAFTFRPQLLKGMLSISGWTMVQSFLSVSVWFIFFLAIEHLGGTAPGRHQYRAQHSGHAHHDYQCIRHYSGGFDQQSDRGRGTALSVQDLQDDAEPCLCPADSPPDCPVPVPGTHPQDFHGQSLPHHSKYSFRVRHGYFHLDFGTRLHFVQCSFRHGKHQGGIRDGNDHACRLYGCRLLRRYRA